jgi:hypothetical protein
MTMDIVAVIGFVSSLLGIVSFFVALKGWQHKTFHVVYGVLLVLLGIALIYTQAQRSSDYNVYQANLNNLKDIERQAAVLSDTYFGSDEGAHRGYVLQALTFLEKHRERFPDTYARAVQFAESAGVLKGQPDDLPERFNQRDALRDAAEAMKALLKGLGRGAAT